MPYASRDDMTSAVEGSVREALEADPDVLCVSAGSRTLCQIDHSHACCRTITEDDIEAHMMTTTGGSPPLDILVRTSGVQRFSDFLLWQVRTVTCGHRGVGGGPGEFLKTLSFF